MSRVLFDHGPLFVNWIDRRHWGFDLALPARWYLALARWHNAPCHATGARHRFSARLFRRALPETRS